MSADIRTGLASGGPRHHAGPPEGLPRLLLARFGHGPVGLDQHLGRHGSPLRCVMAKNAPDRLIEEIWRAGLTGRGGASFPTGRKLAAVAAAPGRPFVVANGTEGEPASAKDKVLLATEPHLVLDGAVLAAEMVRARRVVVVVHAAVRDIVDQAVAEREAAGLDRVRVQVLTAAGGFVAGEASAVVHWAGRGIPAPTPVPPRLSERGLHGRPTLVQNVETLAHLALIARYGADWFREVGTPAEPGSMLLTVVGAVRSPGVAEVEIGLPVTEVIARSGGPAAPLSALLVGGYFGTWVPWPAATGLAFSAAGLASMGAAPGAGLVAALRADVCGLTETARLARYLADESAGQCGPCVFGLDAIARELAELARGRTGGLPLIRRWLGQVDGRGACRHPDGAVRMIRSALDAFGPELDQHAAGWCTGTGGSAVLPVPPPGRREIARAARVLLEVMAPGIRGP
jgi:NADH:ubiquinone oxidoreductase subunit F (NADH-binding)